jgi:hypothetical protein
LDALTDLRLETLGPIVITDSQHIGEDCEWTSSMGSTSIGEIYIKSMSMTDVSGCRGSLTGNPVEKPEG